MFHEVEKELTDKALKSLPSIYKRALKRFLDFHNKNIGSIRCNMLNKDSDGCLIAGGIKIFIYGTCFDDEVSDDDIDILMFNKLGFKDIASPSSLLTIMYSDSMSLNGFNRMTKNMNDYSINELMEAIDG